MANTSSDFALSLFVSFALNLLAAATPAAQVPGGYLVSRMGGRRVLPAGVTLWSSATAAVPVLAGTIPGAQGWFCGGAARSWCAAGLRATASCNVEMHVADSGCGRGGQHMHSFQARLRECQEPSGRKVPLV